MGCGTSVAVGPEAAIALNAAGAAAGTAHGRDAAALLEQLGGALHAGAGFASFGPALRALPPVDAAMLDVIVKEDPIHGLLNEASKAVINPQEVLLAVGVLCDASAILAILFGALNGKKVKPIERLEELKQGWISDIKALRRVLRQSRYRHVATSVLNYPLSALELGVTSLRSSSSGALSAGKVLLKGALPWQVDPIAIVQGLSGLAQGGVAKGRRKHAATAYAPIFAVAATHPRVRDDPSTVRAQLSTLQHSVFDSHPRWEHLCAHVDLLFRLCCDAGLSFDDATTSWLVMGDEDFKGILSYLHLGASDSAHPTPMERLHAWGGRLDGVLRGQAQLGEWLRDGVSLLRQELEAVARRAQAELQNLARGAADLALGRHTAGGAAAARAGLQAMERGILSVGAVFCGRIQIAGKWQSALPVGEAQCTKGAEVAIEGTPGLVQSYSPGICKLLSSAASLLDLFPLVDVSPAALCRNVLARAHTELGHRLESSIAAVQREFGGTLCAASCVTLGVDGLHTGIERWQCIERRARAAVRSLLCVQQATHGLAEVPPGALEAAQQLLSGIEATTRALRASLDAVHGKLSILPEVWSSVVETTELQKLIVDVMTSLEPAERASLSAEEQALTALTLLPTVQDAWRSAIAAVMGVRSSLEMAHDTCTRIVDTIRHTLGAIRASIRGLASTANDGTSSAALDALKMAAVSTIDEIGELPAQFDLVDLSCLSGILDDISQKVRATAQSVCDTLKESLHDELQSVIDSAEGALGLEDIEDEASALIGFVAPAFSWACEKRVDRQARAELWRVRAWASYRVMQLHSQWHEQEERKSLTVAIQEKVACRQALEINDGVSKVLRAQILPPSALSSGWQASCAEVETQVQSKLTDLTNVKDRLRRSDDPLVVRKLIIQYQAQSRELSKAVANISSLGTGMNVLVELVTGVQDSLHTIEKEVQAVRADLARIDTKLDVLTGRPALDVLTHHMDHVTRLAARLPQQVYIPVDGLRPGPQFDFEESSSNPATPLLQVVKTFLSNQKHQTLLIHGPAGSGKTVFMHQLQLYIAGTFRNERRDLGEHIVVLNSALPTLKNPLTDLFEETLKTGYGFRDTQVHELRDKIQQDKAIRVVFVLDGYDEMRAEYLFRNLYRMNNLESYRYQGDEDAKSDRSVWPKVFVLCRSELLSGQEKYCQSFYPLETENVCKDEPAEAIQFFDEIRIAPFSAKFAPYCRMYVALKLRQQFELAFGSFAGIAPAAARCLQFDGVQFDGVDENLREQVQSAFHVVTIGGEREFTGRSLEKLVALPDEAMSKFRDLLNTKQHCWAEHNDRGLHLLAIVAVFQVVKAIDVGPVNDVDSFIENHKEVWTAPTYLDEFNSIPELRELTTTPFMVEIEVQIFPRLKDLQATQATVKRGIIALTSEDLAEKLWGRLRRAGLCGSQRELQQMQRRLANKDPALLKDIQLVSEESCKSMEQQLSTEEVDWILRRVLARQPLRRFAIYACFVQHWIEREVDKRALGAGVQWSAESLIRESHGYSQRLAVRMTEEGLPKVTFKTSSVIFENVKTPFSDFFDDPAKDVIRKCCPLSTNGDFLSFQHKSIQEFCASKAIWKSIQRGIQDVGSFNETKLVDVFHQYPDMPWGDAIGTSSDDLLLDELITVFMDSAQGPSRTKAPRRDAKAIVRWITSLHITPLRTLDLRPEEAIRDFLVDVLLEDMDAATKFLAVFRAASHVRGLSSIVSNMNALVTTPLPKRDGGTLLHAAASAGAAKVLKFAFAVIDVIKGTKHQLSSTLTRTRSSSMNHDDPVNIADKSGRTALFPAVCGGHWNLCERLIQEGANVSHTAKLRTDVRSLWSRWADASSAKKSRGLVVPKTTDNDQNGYGSIYHQVFDSIYTDDDNIFNLPPADFAQRSQPDKYFGPHSLIGVPAARTRSGKVAYSLAFLSAQEVECWCGWAVADGVADSSLSDGSDPFFKSKAFRTMRLSNGMPYRFDHVPGHRVSFIEGDKVVCAADFTCEPPSFWFQLNGQKWTQVKQGMLSAPGLPSAGGTHVSISADAVKVPDRGRGPLAVRPVDRRTVGWATSLDFDCWLDSCLGAAQLTCWGWCAKGALRHRGAAKDIATQVQLDAAGELPDGTRELADDSVHESSSCAADINLNTSLDAISVSQYLGSIDNDRHSTSVYSYDLGDTIALELNLCKTDDKYKQTLSLLKNDNSLKVLDDFDASKYITGHQLGNSSAEIVLQELSNELEGLKSRPAQNQQEQMRQAEISKLVVRMLELRRQEETCHRDTFQFYWCVELYDAGDSVTVAAQNGKELVFTHAPDFVDLDGATATLRCAAGTSKAATALCGAHPMREGLHRANFTVTACKRRNIQVGLILCRQSTMVGLGIPDCCPLFSFQSSSVDDDQVPAETNATDKPQWHGSGWAKARKRRGAWEWLFKDRGDEADTPSASADAFLRQQHWFPLDEPQLANLLLHSQALKDQGRVAGSTAVLPTEEQRPTGECFSTWPNEASLSLVCADSGPPRDGHFTCTTSHSDLRQLISIHSTWVRCMPMADDSASKPAAAHKNTLPLQKRIEARETQRKGHFTYYPAAIVGGAGMLELDFNKDALLRGPDGELWGSVLDHPGDGAVIEAAATDELSTFTVALKLWAEHADDSLRGATSVTRGQNMFHLAAAHNVCVGLLQACTRVGATPELMGQWLVTTDHNGLTPLRTAIRAQAADTMNALFTLAATATITWIENTEKLTTIVEFDGCLEAATGSTLPPLLHEAVQSANGDVVEALVTHCEISNADMANALAILRSMGEVAAGSRIEGLLRGGTPLHAAALCGELPEKRQRYEWHEKRQRYGDPHGVTPFFLACLAGHAATVRELFAWEGSVATTGAPLAESQPPWAPWSVNQTTLSLETMGAGTTPMDVAQTEIQLILRILDGDVLTPFPAKLADSATAGVPEGSLVLSVAVSLQRDDLVIQALHAKADPNQYSTTLDETPLMACVRCDEISMACLDALLEAGGDPTFETQAGDTIWSTSLAKIHDQAVACLLPTVGVAGPASQEFLWRRCQLSPGVAQPESAQEIGEFASSRLGEQPSQSMKQQKEEIDADLVTIKAEADAAMIDWQKRLDTLSFASASLDCLSQSALAELKALKSPPLVVRLVVSAVMVLKRSEPTWAEARKQLADPAFLEKLRNFDKDSVDTVMLDKLGEYTNKAEFEPERVRSASVAAGGLASWCIAVQRYAQSAIEYQPIKMRAQKAERALETKENALAALLSRLHAQWRHAEVLHGYARLQRAGQDGSMANDLHQVCQPLKDLTKQHWREMKCFATPPSWVNTAVTALSLLVSDCDMPETVDWAWNKTNTLARGYELLDTTFNDFDPARITVANLNRFRQLMAKSGGMKAEVEAEAALKAAEAEAAAAAEAEAAAAAAAAAQLESMKAISLFAGALWDFAMRFAKLLDDREACDASEKRFHQRQCVPAVARRAIVQQLLPVWTETINARDTVVARDIMTITAKDTNAEHMVLADTLQAVESMNAQHDSAQAVAHSSRVSTLAHALRQICAMLQCFHSILELLTTACHEIATATPTTLASWTDAYDTTALANVASELGSSLQLCLFRQHGAIVDQLINARTLVGDSCDDADQGEEWQAYLQSLAHDLEDALRTYATRVLHEAGWEHERGTELILRLDEVIGLTVAKFLDGHGH